ncbi:MAG: TonB-dependent receptor [Bacteroidia bacterium]
MNRKPFLGFIGGMKWILFVLQLCFSLLLTAQRSEKATLSGYVRDAQTGESLPGAAVVVKGTTTGAVANTYGFYSLTLPKGNYQIQCAYLGYLAQTDSLALFSNQSRNYELQVQAKMAGEYTVTDDKARQNTESTRMSTIDLQMEEVKKMPVLFGEVDILKTIQLLPGVKGAAEGSSGFYVRGGGPDQNLILLDNATVYNASHLFGFFSVFNSDAIKNAELIKGGMPARYGGRLSSVLDISMKEGNMKEFHGSGGIGLIASRLTLEGPIAKDKLSFLVSGRRTYVDVLLLPFSGEGSALNGNSYYFYDLNAKLQWKIGEKDRLFFSGYYGEDIFNFRSSTGALRIDIPWGNAIASLRWNHQFDSRLFLNTTASFTDYNFRTGARGENFSFELNSGIRDYTLKTDFYWTPNSKHLIRYGSEMVFHEFRPSTVQASLENNSIGLPTAQVMYALDGSLYAEDDWNISTRWKANLGFRLSYFQHTGPFDRFIKGNDGTNIDTVSYSNLENIQDYFRAEPRIALRYLINENSSLKGAFTINYQNLHLANLATVSLPTDIWLPSTSLIPPQQSIQGNLGYFHNFFNNALETSVEVYYKHMDNLVEYRDNSSFGDLVNDNPDNILVLGSGRSYGAEFFIKKRLGKITGWIGYTLSWTERFNFDKNLVSYDGDSFFPRYDRRHDISVTATWEVSKRWTLSGVFVYSTGNVLAVPSEFYFLGDDIIPFFTDRDNFRMMPYHRLDLSATYVIKKTDKWENSLNISIYNVYSRLNPFFVYFDIESDSNTGAVNFQGKQVSLFPIIPAVTWNFSF